MRAVIFNSGVGKRMGSLTENSHKSLVQLANGETIFRRQLRILRDCGINDFLVTTGPYPEQLQDVTSESLFSDCSFTFVENPEYLSTNYIYSMYLAREHFDGEVLMLHGDLVFDRKLIEMVLSHPARSLATFNPSIPLPEKDFKARVVDGCIREVSVSIFGEDCFAFQPIYRLAADDAAQWMRAVEGFVSRGDTGVYAENALNTILSTVALTAVSYDGYMAEEVDTPDDLTRVAEDIRALDFDQQRVLEGQAGPALESLLRREKVGRYLVVCGDYFTGTDLHRYLDSIGVEYELFTDFQPNPLYEEAVAGVGLYRSFSADLIVSIGGGSAIDVAKAIKLYLAMDPSRPFIDQEFVFSPVRHISIPTTAGTGSESTRYSVLYYDGVKQSITHDSAVPDYVVLDPSLLTTLPAYQKSATMLDAFSQAIESYWSVNSTPLSKSYSRQSIELFLSAYESYLGGSPSATSAMMKASNLAGKAINITQTTAPHAMSYKLTSLYGLAHGHAVALCVPAVWRYMIDHTADTVDPRGSGYLSKIFEELSLMLGGTSAVDAVDAYQAIVSFAGLSLPDTANSDDAPLLSASVNPTRLGNSPVSLTSHVLEQLYREILSGE